ncbi:MAG: acyltransferase family protein [Solirubrobacteraceae bacterium]
MTRRHAVGELACAHPLVRHDASVPRDSSAAPLAPTRVAADKRSREVRPEIQALRAIAVLLVLVYHLWPSSIPGGFIGVDVFFAISGFLITSHLMREVDRRGTISLPAFWARRARRLLPAALVVLLFSAVATILIVPITRWEQYFGDLRASTVYGQNWHLASVAVDYFASENEPSPVQHYWSLSAEEQFYAVWPVLIVFAIAIRTKRSSVAAVLSIVTAASLAYSIRHTGTNPAAAYFITPTRGWEFGAGGLLALLPQGPRSGVLVPSGLAWIGLIAIVLAAFAYTAGTTPFPGHAALLPVLGALAVMRAGAPAGAGSPAPLLKLPPVQFVGDISYSVYLWHWPLLILAPYVVGRVGTDTRIGILVLTLLAAWLTKLLIEDPVRTGGLLTHRKPRFTFAAAVAGMAVVLAVSAAGAAAARTKGEPGPIPRSKCFGAAARDPLRPCRDPTLRLTVVPTPLQAKRPPKLPCTVIFSLVGKRVCAIGASAAKATRTVALIGDSHAGHWRLAVVGIARKKGWRVLAIGHAGCPFSKATKLLPEPDRSHCLKWKRAVFAWFGKHPEVKTVFVSQFSHGTGVATRPGQDQFGAQASGYAGAWNALPASVEQIVVIRDTPHTRGDTDNCVQGAIDSRRPAGPACAVPRREALVRDPAAVAAARMNSPRVRVADLTPFFCDRQKCYPVVGGALVYKDATHLTQVYSASLAPYLQRSVDRAWPSKTGPCGDG